MNRPLRIYVATSWRNPHHASYVASLRAAGYEVYDFKNPVEGNNGFAWRNVVESLEVGKDYMVDPVAFRDEVLNHEIAKQGFNFDFTAMHWADVIVMLLQCGKSAHLELGWGAGAGKRTVVHFNEDEVVVDPELMYLMADVITTSEEELFEKLAEWQKAPRED